MSNSEEREVLRKWRQSRRQHRDNDANQDVEQVGDDGLSDQEGGQMPTGKFFPTTNISLPKKLRSINVVKYREESCVKHIRFIL